MGKDGRTTAKSLFTRLVVDWDKMKSLVQLNMYLLIIIYPFLPIIKERSTLIGNIFEIIILSFLAIGMFYKKNGSSFRISKRLIFLILVIALMTGMYMTDFFDVELYDLFSASRVFFFYLLLLVNVTNLISNDIAMCKRIVILLSITTIIFTLGALIQFFLPEVILDIHGPDALIELRRKSDFIAFSFYNRVMSFMIDPNLFGVFMAFNAISLFQLKKFVKGSLKLSIILGCSIVSILLSQSRSALVIVLLYFIFRYLEHIKNIGKINFKDLLLPILVFTLFDCFLYLNSDSVAEYLRMETILDGNGRIAHNIVRYNYILNQNMFNILFGNGLSIGRDIVFENSYLLMVYELGIIGSLILLFWMFFMTKDIFSYSDNIIFGICYLVVNFVGDYILVPQITYIVIVYSLLNREFYIESRG